MLIMPLDKVTILLEQASGVEISPLDEVSENEAADEGDDASEGLEEAVAASPAYRALAETLRDLSPLEVYELLAVAIMGEADDAEDSWKLAVQRAQAVAAEDAVDELARILVLTDAIEIGLDRLGYSLEEDDEVEGVDAEDEAEGKV